MNPVGCTFANEVRLRWAQNWVQLTPTQTATLSPAGTPVVGQRRVREEGGKQFPMWVFNDVPITTVAYGEEYSASIKSYFFVEVLGVQARTNVWAHASDPRTLLPGGEAWEMNPATPQGVDSRIAIVWPHDRQGSPQPVAQAPLANIGVDLTYQAQPGLYSVGMNFNQPVRLFRALNNGLMEPVATGTHEIASGTANGTTRTWPRWMFNDVDVYAAQDGTNRYYFMVLTDGIQAQPTIWAHGADARTYFPQREVPARSCQS